MSHEGVRPGRRNPKLSKPVMGKLYLKKLGVLTWGEEIDIAPETLYAEAINVSLPEWMDSQTDFPPCTSFHY